MAVLALHSTSGTVARAASRTAANSSRNILRQTILPAAQPLRAVVQPQRQRHVVVAAVDTEPPKTDNENKPEVAKFADSIGESYHAWQLVRYLQLAKLTSEIAAILPLAVCLPDMLDPFFDAEVGQYSTCPAAIAQHRTATEFSNARCTLSHMCLLMLGLAPTQACRLTRAYLASSRSRRCGLAGAHAVACALPL